MNIAPWTPADLDLLLRLDGTPLREVAARLGRSVQAIKNQRRALRRAGRLGGWDGPRCRCGRPMVAHGLCHNHYQQAWQKRAALERLVAAREVAAATKTQGRFVSLIS